MATYQDNQKLADAVYKGSSSVKVNNGGTSPTTWTRVKEHSNLLNGYYGALYKSDNGEYIMVNRGTDKFSPPDYGNDAQMFFKQEIPAQYADAKQFYHEVQQYIAENGGGSFTLDGHSLGGTLSQMLSVEFGTQAVTFNPFSARNILDSLQPLSEEQHSQFTQQKAELEARILNGEQLSIELTTQLAYVTNQLSYDAAIHSLAENWQNGSEGNILNYLIKGDPVSDVFSSAQLGDSITFSDLDHIGLGSHFINDFSIENLSTENLFNLSGTSGANSKLQELLEYFKDKTNWEIDSAGSGYRISKDHELFFGVVKKGDDWSSTGDDRSQLVTDLRDSLYTKVGLASVVSAAEIAQKHSELLAMAENYRYWDGSPMFVVKHELVNADKQTYLLLEEQPQPLKKVLPVGDPGQMRFDPLVLDLNNNQKIDTVGLEANVLFNHSGDSTKNGTGWVAKTGDGFVVYDKNNNGSIENGGELLGDNFIMSSGRRAFSAYDALSDFDSNKDLVVDANDARFKDLKIWRDANQNGISESGELKTLSELGIASINVVPENTAAVDLGNGNIQVANGSFIRSDGTTGYAGAINFAADPTSREFIDSLDTSNLLNLPDVRATGSVRDLREAAAMSGDFASKLENYTNSNSRNRWELEAIVLAWASTSDMVTLSKYIGSGVNPGNGLRGSNLTGTEIMRLGVLEKFTGIWGATYGIIDPKWTAINFDVNGINQRYEELLKNVDVAISMASNLKDAFAAIGYKINENGIQLDFSKIYTQAESDPDKAVADMIGLYENFHQTQNSLFTAESQKEMIGWIQEQIAAGANPLTYAVKSNFLSDVTKQDDFIVMGAGNDIVDSGSGNDVIYGLVGNDSLIGASGNDYLAGGDGDDYLYDDSWSNILVGGAGNDTLQGYSNQFPNWYYGSNTFQGEIGNDTLKGGYASDTYIYNLGDGNDTIYDLGGADTLKFGEGINKEDFGLEKSGNDLFLKIGSDGSVLLKDWYTANGNNGFIENLLLADGTTINLKEFSAYGVGGDSNDTMQGWNGVDNLAGGLGNDTLTAYAGNDILDGGDGNDYIDGGNDRYYVAVAQRYINVKKARFYRALIISKIYVIRSNIINNGCLNLIKY